MDKLFYLAKEYRWPISLFFISVILIAFAAFNKITNTTTISLFIPGLIVRISASISFVYIMFKRIKLKNSISNNIGSIIKEARMAKAITQQELADLTGLNKRTIQRIENGDVKPSLYSIRRIEESLEIKSLRFRLQLKSILTRNS